MVNHAANGLGRFSTLTSWLSQWSLESRATGPESLACTSIPVLQVEYTADQSTFPSDAAKWSEAPSGRRRQMAVRPITDSPAQRTICEDRRNWSRS